MRLLVTEVSSPLKKIKKYYYHGKKIFTSSTRGEPKNFIA
jgi:hypothetical protein